MIVDLPQPILFAHRGASAYAPENTISAFEIAINQGADAIELDVKLSADGEVVVIHDNKVDRTTDGSGKVSSLELASLKGLDAGYFFDESFIGEEIPTLNEVFESIGSRIFINIELTNYSTPLDRLPEKTAEIVNHHGLTESILFSSFNPLALQKSHKLLSKVPIGLLTTPGLIGGWAYSFLGRFIAHNALHPEFSNTNQHLIEKCHQRGIRVHPYTVNSFERMVGLFQMDVDGIFTDDIPLAQQARMLVMEKKCESNDY